MKNTKYKIEALKFLLLNIGFMVMLIKNKL